MKFKCLMILSDKSSGSSILMQELAKNPDFKKIQPGKFHDESKYWMYANAILNPNSQPEMRYSYEFPISRENAIKSLNKLMRKSGLDYNFDNKSKKSDFFNGWLKLCQKYQPIFLEKSPHYIHSK